MKTIVINLERSQDRKKHVIEELSKTKWNYSFFTGIEGNNLEFIPSVSKRIVQVVDTFNNKKYYYDMQRRLNGELMKKGDIGCSLSHIELYRQLIEDPINNCYLIFEDDVNLNVDVEIINEYINNLPPVDEYDFAHLCYSDWYQFEKETLVNNYFYKPVKKFFNRLTAYIVTKRGAKKLFERAFPISMPSDDLISYNYLFTDNFKIIVPTCDRPLFIHDDKKFKSTVI
jgi:glycosyl transferase family 25